jgi:hypothetical protein
MDEQSATILAMAKGFLNCVFRNLKSTIGIRRVTRSGGLRLRELFESHPVHEVVELRFGAQRI